MVRRCVHKPSGRELAVKIVELAPEHSSPQQLEEVRAATAKEVAILRQLAGHPHISELTRHLQPQAPRASDRPDIHP